MNRDILLTGTALTEPALRCLRAGPLQAHFGPEGLRWVCWTGVEVLRAVQFLVRTPGWGTPAPIVSDLRIEADASSFSVSFCAHYGAAGAGLVVDVTYEGSASGTLTAKAFVAAEAPFDTNRTGFVILHPLRGFAGTEVLVDHAATPPRRVVIPAQILPGQPVFDIRAITHQPVAGLTVETRFAGDVFEMEDHRNWSDASFKTYSRPIGLPYPYRLLPDSPVTQSVTVTIRDARTDGETDGGAKRPPVQISGAKTDAGAKSRAGPISDVPPINGQRLPDYALPLDRLADAKAALVWREALRALAPQWLLLRLDTAQDGAADLSSLASLIDLTKARLEVTVILTSASNAEAEAEIAAVALRFKLAGLPVERISAFARIDAQSFQPGQARPPHPAEASIAASLARHFGGAGLVGGTPAYFTEFNRKRPDPALWQGLRFATAPVVHAADDASVMETLQALPHILASASALSDGVGLSVGPTGIGARINPYGPGPNLNPPAKRMGMAARDPRQRGLFAAAWTVGYLVRIAPFAPRQFGFGAATGPFGLISTPQDYRRAMWDEMPDGALYPLYHIARWIAAGAGAEVLSAKTQDGVAQIVWRKGSSRQALVANLTARGQPMPDLGLNAPQVCILDAESLGDFAQGAGPHGTRIPTTLDAYCVVFLDEGRESL